MNPNILMKGNDTKRQILLSYYNSEIPVNEITMNRTKQKEIPTLEQSNNIKELEECKKSKE